MRLCFDSSREAFARKHHFFVRTRNQIKKSLYVTTTDRPVPTLLFE